MSIQVASAATNIVRDGHYELVSSVDTRTLLLELSRTNSTTYSQDLSNAAWTKSNSSVTADTAVAPDGSATADTLTATTSTGNGTFTTATASTAGAKHTISAWFKAGDAAHAFVGDSGAGEDNYSWVNLSTGAVSGTLGTSTGRVTAYANGWYRLSATVTRNTTGNVRSCVGISDTGGSTIATNGKYCYVWGVQDEAGSFATSYAATTTPAVTRSADSFYVPFPYTPQAMTIYLKFVERGTITIASAAQAYVGNAGNTGARLWIDSTGTYYRVRHHNGSSEVTATLAAAPAIGDVVELRAVLSATGTVLIGQSIGGATETVTSASSALALATAFGDTRLYLNSTGTSNQGATAILAYRVMRGVQTLTTMRAA